MIYTKISKYTVGMHELRNVKNSGLTEFKFNIYSIPQGVTIHLTFDEYADHNIPFILKIIDRIDESQTRYINKDLVTMVHENDQYWDLYGIPCIKIDCLCDLEMEISLDNIPTEWQDNELNNFATVELYWRTSLETPEPKFQYTRR